MQKNENSDQKSHPKDITQCYGNDCEECRESCRWKEAGRSRMADDRHDHNVKAGTTKVFDFKEKLGSIVFTSGGTEAGNALRLFGIASTEGTVFDKSFAADVIGPRCRMILENHGGILSSAAAGGSGGIGSGIVSK